MADVVMPRLSDSMEEGTILQWLKQVGDEVAVGDELVEIETDKANMAYESDLAGTLTEILAKEGETLPIGTSIARIGDSDEVPAARSAGPVADEEPSSSRDDAPGEEPSSDATRGSGGGNSTRDRRPRAALDGERDPKPRRSPDGWRKSVAWSWGRSWALALAAGS